MTFACIGLRIHARDRRAFEKLVETTSCLLLLTVAAARIGWVSSRAQSDAPCPVFGRGAEPSAHENLVHRAPRRRRGQFGTSDTQQQLRMSVDAKRRFKLRAKVVNFDRLVQIGCGPTLG